MKKLAFLSISALVMTLLTACTLSMEEYIVPEEEKGFDEPVTVESEYGSITYQFNDSVIFVTDNLQDYLIRVEADTILYFSSTMPRQYQPTKGSKLATGISHKLPYGLNHRVLSVENQGGILRVVTTHTSIEDVYKHLDYSIDANLASPQYNELDSAELAKYGLELRDSVITDWRAFDSIQIATRQGKGRLTRAETQDTTTMDVLPDELLNWCMDTRDLERYFDATAASRDLFKAMTDAINKQIVSGSDLGTPYMALKLKIMNYIQAHCERDEDAEYELNYQDTWSEFDVCVECGYEATATPKSKLAMDKIGQYSQMWMDDQAKLAKLFGSGSGRKRTIGYADWVPQKSKAWDNPTLRVPLCVTPVPIAFILTGNVKPELTIGGSVSSAMHFVSAKKHTGYEVKNGERRDFDDLTNLGGSAIIKNIGLNGHFKIGASFRVAAGIEVAAAFAATIGANLEAYAEAEGSFNLWSDKGGWFSPEGKVSFWVDAYGDVQIHVAPLGIHMWDKQVAKFLTKHLIKYSTDFSPRIGVKSGNCTLNDGYFEASAYCSYKDLDGINAFIKAKEYYPGMRMFFGPVKDNDYIDMLMVDGAEEPLANYTNRPEVKEDVIYRFKANGIVPEDLMDVHFLPYIYPIIDGEVSTYFGVELEDAIVCEGDEITYEVGTPKIVLNAAHQVYGAPLYDWSNFTEGYVDANGTQTWGHSTMNVQDYSMYKYCAIVDVRNGSRIASWGARVTIYDSSGKVLLSPRKVPFNVNKSGRYTLLFSFITNWEPKVSIAGGDKLYIQIRPYWKDANGGKRFNAEDATSKTKWPIEAECADLTGNLKKLGGSEEWGSILPEKELEQEHVD